MSQEGAIRADVLVARLAACSRQHAQTLIQQGLVCLEGKPVSKPGAKYPQSAAFTLAPYEKKYVSRGGFKLSSAMDTFKVSAEGEVCADLGASTGGFTDCLLQRGAKKVYAIDNGSGQLDISLQGNPRVVSIEKMNARQLSWDVLGEKCSLVTADLSFISLTLVLPAIMGLLLPGCHALCLVKPEFEAGREALNKRGIVKDNKLRLQALKKVTDFAKSIGFSVLGTSVSAIAGTDGNIEYFAYLENKA
jgi:23S rRNA (cytidine1920-2'-O)/16S rRNA (cytidine1409-2'-O)-methyltransferase